MLTDIHYAVLEMLKDGQPLTLKRARSRSVAKIGSRRIPASIVSDLENANMISCRQAEHLADDGELRGFEFVKDLPDMDPIQQLTVRERRDRSVFPQTEAHRLILSEWKSWREKYALTRPTTDADAHAFLRELKLLKPELLKFRSRISAYEVAFSWLTNAKRAPSIKTSHKRRFNEEAQA